MSDTKDLALAPAAPNHAPDIFGNISAFESAQRIAGALASSDLVPAAYKGKVANVLVAMEVAQATGSSVTSVMQSLDIIHGKPSWSSKYIIAAINGSGRFTPLRFKFEGSGDDLSCRAVAKDRVSGEELVGPVVSMKMAIAEGWVGKTGSKWKTMPELMIQYRAATFFGRLYIPDLLLGMQTEDEIRDITPAGADAVASPTVAAINARVRGKKTGAVIDAEVVKPDPANDNPTVEEAVRNGPGDSEFV